MKIVPRDIVKEMRESYLDYAMSVIVTRALPDARDGLKPVQRRILYAMHELGLASSAKYRKSAMVVGEVLGKYHPHGDTSVYDAMVRLAQDFSMRYQLVDGQGNFGSVDGDSAAAMRYTEARMTKISGEILKDIEKETVDFAPNYDGALKEPKVLPSAIPNLLINGTLGIAVGMATKIPPHNLREVVGATVALIENPKSTTEDLLEFVKGPDFPTSGIIFNAKDIHHAYASGRGGVVIRGEAEIVEIKSGSHQIIISSIPYQVNKAELIIKMADMVKDKIIEGIRDIRDESDKDGLRIAIDLKSGTHPQKVLNNLYKRTELETTYHFNMLALVDGAPQVLSLKSILENFILHRQVVVERRTRFDLKKAEDRAHILEGLKKALDNIDAVIKVIKASKDRDEARTALMKKFQLTEIQTNAILEMRLSTLAGLERKKIEDELDEKKKLIAELKALLKDPKKILKVIKDELLKIAENYGDDRKTKVFKGQAEIIDNEDLIPEAECVLVVTHGGYIKRTDPSEYKRQKRGGTGVIDLDTKEEDFVTNLITANTHDDLLFFTNKGKAFQIKMYEIPEGKRATKGKSIMNFLALSGDEKITSVLAFPKEMKEKKMSLVMVTKNGVIKKVKAESFHDVRRSGIISIKLSAGDELGWAYLVEKGDDIILASSSGQSIRFKESDAREMGRTAGGVRAIKLRAKDELIGADVMKKDEKDASFLVLSKNGFGKRTSIKEYKVQKRGGSGIKTSKVTEKTGSLMKALVIKSEFEEAIAISKKGQIIRTALSDIPVLGRQTQGVRIMKLKTGDSIASLTCL